MKIVIVGTAFPLRGGIAHYNGILATRLAKRHTVETITFLRQYPAFLFPGKTQEESGNASEEMRLSPAPQLIDSINPFNWLSVAKRIAAMKPDLLIFKYWLPFFGPCFGTIAKFVKKRTPAKALFICDNVIPHERRPGDIAFTKYAFRQADCFIVQSDSVERDLLKLVPGAKYKKIAHPVYENFGQAIPQAEARETLGIRSKNVILFFGYIRKYKGLAVLLEAFRNLLQDEAQRDTLLLVVGEFYDDEQKYRSLAKELKINSSVHFVSNYVPNDQVGAYFSASDLVVLPYLSATQSGIAQIAYNFNKPVIATNVGGLAEVILDNKTGFIVSPDNPQALADAIARYYRESRQAEFSANDAIEKKKYSWDTMIEAIEELAK
ncbi:MAG TPA: glycosyltransferase [Bacteroidota bacterium]|nr:glycosyltransferase [Bacteroidota bacterium]